MKNRRILPKGRQSILGSVGASCLLLFGLCLSLTGCDGHFLSIDCIGSSGFCGPVAPTPDAPSLVATAQALTAGKPLLTDPMSKQDNNDWAGGNGCSFRNGAYVVTYSGSSSGTQGCFSLKLSYRDAAIAVDVTLISGDFAGIAFRTTPDFASFYEFLIGKGQFLVNLIIPITSSNAVRGLKQTNRLLVIARGTDFQLFINGTFVGEVQDPTLSAAGSIGAILEYSSNSEARLSNLAIYSI
jgi:hypothetical protein